MGKFGDNIAAFKVTAFRMAVDERSAVNARLTENDEWNVQFNDPYRFKTYHVRRATEAEARETAREASIAISRSLGAVSEWDDYVGRLTEQPGDTQ